MRTDLFFQNGKPKKKYMKCLSPEKLAELRKLYGRTIVQCAGLGCPYYSVGCGRMKLEKYQEGI